MTADPSESGRLGFCRQCGVAVYADAFRDHAALREYRSRASCQRCQDIVLIGVGNEVPPVLHPVRHGVVVAPALGDDGPSEVALLPFLFVVAPKRLVWEPRHTVRAGPALLPVDPWAELRTMYGASQDHVRVLCVRSLADPAVHRTLTGRDLVIGLDDSSVRVATQLCPEAPPAALVNLADAVPWGDAYGSPLVPLSPFLRANARALMTGSADRCRTSVLRQCALLTRLLALPAAMGRDVGRPAFELLLRAHAARLADSLREISDGDG